MSRSVARAGSRSRARALTGLGALLGGCLVLLLLVGWPVRRYVLSGERTPAVGDATRESPRILILGDSFLADWPYPHHLKRDIAHYAAERGVEVRHRARHGLGPQAHLRELESSLSDFRPDLVLLFYSVGNDLTDVQYRGASAPGSSPAVRAQVDPACRVAPARRRDGARGFDWEAMREHGIDPELIRSARTAPERPRDPGGERVSPWVLRLAMQAPRYLLDNLLMDSPCNGQAWAVTSSILSASFEAAREAGSEPVLVALPASAQIDRIHFNFYRRAGFEIDARLDGSTRPQQLLAELAARRSVRLLDLLPDFASHPEPASLYGTYDPHFSEAGHVFAFRILRERLLTPWLASRAGARPAR